MATVVHSPLSEMAFAAILRYIPCLGLAHYCHRAVFDLEVCQLPASVAGVLDGLRNPSGMLWHRGDRAALLHPMPGNR